LTVTGGVQPHGRVLLDVGEVRVKLTTYAPGWTATNRKPPSFPVVRVRAPAVALVVMTGSGLRREF
jgi:hypothetical protein